MAGGLNWEALTPAEERVALLVGRGTTNKAVARELGVSAKTVEFHLRSVFSKLGISTRGELAHALGRRRDGGTVTANGQLPRDRIDLVGREADLERLLGMISTARPVTVVGPGGVGKTSLALAAAHRLDGFADGRWFVDLATVASHEYVAASVAAAMGLRLRGHGAVAVADAIGDRHALVLLDTCEHVVDGVAALMEAIAARCPGITILATSRSLLSVQGEQLLELRPLSVDSAHGRSVAATLFINLATDIATVAGEGSVAEMVEQLCRSLDGLPLAIELAAAQTRSLGLARVADIVAAGESPAATRRHGPVRHRSLDATIEVSHALLTAAGSAFFESLAVFSGWFDLDIVTAVWDGRATSVELETHLAELGDASMIVRQHQADGRVRYRLLDTLRSFAERRLQLTDRFDTERALFATAVATWLEHADRGLKGRDEHRWDRAIDDQWGHVQGAMAAACDLDSGDLVVRLVQASRWWSLTRVRPGTAGLLERALLVPSITSHSQRCVVLAAASQDAELHTNHERAVELLWEALAAEADLSGSELDPLVPCLLAGIAELPDEPLGALPKRVEQRGTERNDEFWIVCGRLQYDVVVAYVLAHRIGSETELDTCRSRLRGDLERAIRYGNPNGIAYAQMVLACGIRYEAPDEAIGLLEASLETATALHIELTAAQARRELADIRAARGDHADALALLAPALRRHLREGSLGEARRALAASSRPLASMGRADLAASTLGCLETNVMPGDDLVDLESARQAIAAALDVRELARATAIGATAGIATMARQVADAIDELLAARPAASA